MQRLLIPIKTSLRPRPLRLFALIAGLLLLVGCYATARAEGPPFEPGAILVRWGTSGTIRTQDSTLLALEARPVHSIPQLGIIKLQVPPGTEQAAAAALRRAGAESAGLNYVRRAALVPNDTYYSQQWALSQINASSAWDISTGSSNIIVAVVDTGFDLSHPDQPKNLIRGADYVLDIKGNTLVTGDPQGHGTHVAGIVAANMNNGIGVAGIAPSVSLMSIRVLDAAGNGNTYSTSLGITYAVDHGAKVINLSLSGEGESDSETAAINYAYSKGALVVAAAGNDKEEGNPREYPAASKNVMAVAATTINDTHAYYSNTGDYVDVAAPGGGPDDEGRSPERIWSTCNRSPDFYCTKAGTSMATPYAAGVAALVWSINPNLTVDQVEAILRQSAKDLGTPGWDDTFGYGRVDAYQAAVQARATTGYAAQYVSQSFPFSMTVGQQVTASVQLKNVGGTTWQQGTVRLGTSQPKDRSSSFYTPGNWVSTSRPAN
ncbi:MAG: S8 family peptidase, partial [Dehalococcoidia bacterium]|nr:S8 family peptidase [Dehalococcoidia bacterium]